MGGDQNELQAAPRTLDAGRAMVTVMGEITRGPPKQLVPSKYYRQDGYLTLQTMIDLGNKLNISTNYSNYVKNNRRFGDHAYLWVGTL